MLTLRALEPEDLDLLYLVENDRTLWPVGTTNEPYSYFALRQFLELCTNDIYVDRQLRLVIQLDGEPIGFADLLHFQPEDRRAEVGIMILEPHRHRGHGVSALSALEQYAAGTLHLHQLYAYVAEGNVVCQKTFLRAGYRHAATLADWLWHGDSYEDVVVMQKNIENNY